MRNDTENIRQQGDGSLVISAKVRREVAEQVFRLVKRRGLRLATFIQMVCEVALRYMGGEHTLSPEMDRCMSVFRHLGGWEEAVLLSRPGDRLEVLQAVYMLGAEGRKGVAPVMVTRPFFGDWQQTENEGEILDAVLKGLMPERHRRLSRMAADMGCANLADLMDTLIDRHATDEELAELHRPFEDNRRSEWGRTENTTPYRAHPRRSMEAMGTLFGGADSNDNSNDKDNDDNA